MRRAWQGIRPRGLRLRTVLFLSVGLGATALGLVAYGTDALRKLELDSVDARFSIRGTEKPPSALIVVQIDDVTFDELNLRWPFPRTVHAKVIDRIAADHPKAIAYDVEFTEPTVPREDNALIRAVSRAGDVVLSTTRVNGRGESNIFGGEEVLGLRFGTAFGRLRRAPLFQVLLVARPRLLLEHVEQTTREVQGRGLHGARFADHTHPEDR